MEKLSELLSGESDRLGQEKKQQDRHRAAGGVPDLWLEWGTVLNEDLLDLNEDLDSMGKLLDPSFALKIVAKGSRAWAVVGLILKRIKRYELWAQMQYKSYADFCQRVLGRSVQYCNNTIRGAEVCLELARAGHEMIPTCQSQAIALRKIVSEQTKRPGLCPEVLRERWQEILSAAKDQCKQITTDFINSIANPDKPRKKDRRVQFDPNTWDLVEQQAAAAGLDPKQWLDRLIRQQEENNAIASPSPEAQENWERDLEALADEENSQGATPPPAPQEQNTEGAMTSQQERSQQREQIVVDSEGEAYHLPTLFDVERYAADSPAVPAQLVEDGEPDPWSPPAQNFASMSEQNNEGAASHQQASEQNNEGAMTPPKAKRKRSRRTLGQMFGMSSGAYRPAPT